MAKESKITKRVEDYSEWYLDIVREAELAENSEVRGCMVIKPYGYAIWENIQRVLDSKIKATGHQNAYFPIFIPKSYLSREAEHVEGFAKECAVVTHHRLKLTDDGKQVIPDPEARLNEELVVRPTSETIIYNTFSKWIESYRDLPVLINQWANVVRWELRTRPFLRTTEFLWQEGHTAHGTLDEAEAEALKMLGVYQLFAEKYLALPVIAGMKSESEKFAGALRTYTIEGMMQDGKALQSGTSHNLGDHFAKAFEVKFIDKDGIQKYVFQTSWGLSTRIIGGLIMTHSDDEGLVLPPNIAPYQVVIIPFGRNEKDIKIVNQNINVLTEDLNREGISFKIDNRDYLTSGNKIYEWIRKGVPLRIEIGPRDLVHNSVTVVRRDINVKESVSLDNLVEFISQKLDEIQKDMFEKALKYRNQKTVKVDTWDEFKTEIENNNFVLAHWCGESEVEEKIKDETLASIRCIPFDEPEEEGKCIYSGKLSKKRVLFAKSY